MADGRLEVQVGANVSELQQKLGSNGSAEKVIDQFTKNGGRSLQSLQAEAKRTGTAFIGFSRVLQDAAYGPAAIANNLEGLGHDLAMLKRQAADTGQSIGKTLVQSLMGAGGFNLAIGAATLAMSLASVGLTAWTRLFPDNKKEVDKASKSIDDYSKSLNSVQKAQLEGLQNSQNEIITLKTLYTVATDTSKAYGVRKSAVDQLQNQYPSYFQNIKDETILNGGAKTAYNELSKAILQTARARAGIDQLTENAKKQLELEKRITDAQAYELKVREIQQKQADIRRSSNIEEQTKAQQALIKSRASIGFVDILGGGQAIKDLEVLGVLQGRLNILKLEDKRISDQVNDAIIKGGKVIESTGDAIKETTRQIDRTPIQLKIESVGVNSTVSGLEKLKGTLEGLRPTAIDWVSDWQKRTNELSQTFSQTLTGGLVDFSSAFIEGIAGLATGAASLSDVGGMLLGIVGDIAIQLGKAAIGIGVGMLAIKAAFANPLTAIAAGVALVAIGAVIKGAAGIVQGGGSSGGSTQVANTSSGSSNQYSARGASYVGSSGPQIVEFRQRGRDLVAVVELETGRNLRTS